MEELPTDETVFTHADREMITEIHTAITELQALVKQVEPLLESLGGGNGPVNPMSMIMGSLMGGKR